MTKARALLHASHVCITLLFITSQAHAQAPGAQAPPAPRETQAAAPRQGTPADEDFVLDIAERRISESDLYAATELKAGDPRGRGLDLGVGVMVRAGQAEVLLREVRGRVRFRASLGPLRRLLDVRGAAGPPAPPEESPSVSPK